MIALRICNVVFVMIFLFAAPACEKQYPSVDEVSKIKDLIGKLQREVKTRNAAAIDSMIIASAAKEGYSSLSILEAVYPDPTGSEFYAFANKEIIYKHDKGEIIFNILADSTDKVGRPAGMTIVKIEGNWYIKRFELK